MNDAVKDTGLTLRQMRLMTGFNFLCMAAMQRKTVHSDDLHIILGVPQVGNIGHLTVALTLYDIHRLCSKMGMESLTVLVVRKSGPEQGLPGPGYWRRLGVEGTLSKDEKRIMASAAAQRCYDRFAGVATNTGDLAEDDEHTILYGDD